MFILKTFPTALKLQNRLISLSKRINLKPFLNRECKFINIKVRNLSVSKTPKPSLKDKLKSLWQKYGTLAIVTYGSVYFFTISSFYIAIETKSLNFRYLTSVYNSYVSDERYRAPIDLSPQSIVDKMVLDIENLTGDNSARLFFENNPKMKTLFFALFLTSFTDFIRIPFTILVVPKIARFIGK